MQRPNIILTSKRITLLALVMLSFALTIRAQEQPGKEQPSKDWEGEGELKDVTIEIVKERKVTVPKANRNFEKIPPRASEPIKPPITYDFRTFNFQAPQITTQVRPLKLKAEQQSHLYGGFLRAGFGNYVSPLLEGYINSTRDKNKLVGAQFHHRSSDKGPVDGKNSGSGSTGISAFGQSFNDAIALSGNVGFENRTTHFYGYAPGTNVDASAIKQTYDLFKLGGELANSKNSDFSYKLGAGFSFLKDKYDARETEVGFNFSSAYELDDDQHIAINADYYIISRKDSQVEAKARNLFTVAPSYQFVVLEDLKLSVGIIAAYENDTIDSKKLHFYPNVNASYPLSPSVDAVASLTGGIEKVSLQSLSYENLWLAQNIDIFHTNKQLDFSAGLKARLGNKVGVHAGMSFASLKNWYYFVNSQSDQAKFDVVYDGGAGTRRANFFAALSYAQSETAKFMLRGDFFNYGTGSLAGAWHRPTYKLTANGSYNLYDKFIFSADLIAQGGMKTMDPVTDTEVKLDAAFDLNFKTEYLFSKSFSAFVQLHNITSNKYPLFLNYPVRGFQLMAGITWSF